MSNNKGWKEGKIINGICHVEIDSWQFFHDYIIEEMQDFEGYVWRGQRDSSWPLKSSLDRLLDKAGSTNPSAHAKHTKQHLAAFQKATRGRRGVNPPKLNDQEWWALGQHNGLATPLLDWSDSPFVGLYFAFEKADVPSSGMRAVWAITHTTDENKKAEADNEWHAEPKTLSFIRPNQNENPRLLSQAGLFTQGPAGKNVEEWVERYASGNSTEMTLIKIMIPDTGRRECIRTLNQMNINHATLFPDLYGAGAHCNRSLELSLALRNC